MTVFRSTAMARQLGARGTARAPSGVLILASLLALAVLQPDAAAAAPEQPSAPRQSPATQQQAQDTTERVQVEGFRSARWGMTEAQVIIKICNGSDTRISR